MTLETFWQSRKGWTAAPAYHVPMAFGRSLLSSIVSRSLWLVVWLALWATSAAAQAPPPDLRLLLVVHLTLHDGVPVLPPEDVPRLIEVVNQHYRDAGICFWLKEVRALRRSADLRTYRERHSFVSALVPGAVNVILVNSIYDPSSSESTVRTAARFGFVPSVKT